MLGEESGKVLERSRSGKVHRSGRGKLARSPIFPDRFPEIVQSQ